MAQQQQQRPGTGLFLPALVVTAGMQIIRTLPPYLQYLLGDRLHWRAPQLGLVGLAIFSTAFLAAWLNRKLGLRRLLLVSAGGLGLVRLGMQVWAGDPLVDMALMVAGTGLFILYLPAGLLLAQYRPNPAEAGRRFGLAILLGLALDTWLHGLFHTYDFIWQNGAIPLALAAGVVLLLWAALRAAAPNAPPHPAPVDGALPEMLPWLVLGPFLFLQLLVFQNQARLATLTGWLLPAAFGWTLFAHLLGLTAAAWWRPRLAGAVAAGGVLAAATWPFFQDGVFAAITLVVGQVSAAVLLATAMAYLAEAVAAKYYTLGTPRQPKEGIQSTTVWHGAGMVLLVGLIFAYYVAFNLPVPYKNGWLLSGAGLVVAAGAIFAAARLSPGVNYRPRPSLWPVMVWLLLLLPLGRYAAGQSPVDATSTGLQSVRVMTYNLHNGFNTAGHLNLEAIAGVVQAEQPDIVALQEVSRGWVVNGSVDMLNWLAGRLDMPYRHFTPSSDALWGQAILSRYPILTATDHPLPPRNLPLKRSFTYAKIDTGRPLQVINTHFHHIQQDSDIRGQQVESVLRFLTGREPARLIITGDLNATPDAAEIRLLYKRGFIDVVSAANLLPGYTFNSVQPYKRLDYLLVSPDLAASQVVIPNSTASDHRGIAATIRPKN